MAKVVQPLMSGAARGKLGNLIFNTWRSLNTVKLFRSPAQPKTDAQLAARALLTSVSQAWAALSSVVRAGWQQYAIDHLETDWTGQAKRLTGQNWFVRCSSRAQLVGGSAPASAPVDPPPAAPTGLGVAMGGAGSADVQLDWDTPTVATTFLAVYSAGPISAGRIPRFEQSAILAKIAGNTSAPYTLIAACPNGRYGFWIQAIDSLTGLASPLIFEEITVT